MTDDGFNTIVSRRGVPDTIDALVEAVTAHGLTIFARIDYSAGATGAGLNLRPTQLLIFGNPKSETPLIGANQVAAIDLPLKALAWQDEDGEVWLTYPDIDTMADRHGLGGDLAGDIASIRGDLAKLVVKAVGM